MQFVSDLLPIPDGQSVFKRPQPKKIMVENMKIVHSPSNKQSGCRVGKADPCGLLQIQDVGHSVPGIRIGGRHGLLRPMISPFKQQRLEALNQGVIECGCCRIAFF